MVTFQTDSERMEGKTEFFVIYVEMSSFFRKTFGARYLIVKYQGTVMCRLQNEGIIFWYTVS